MDLPSAPLASCGAPPGGRAWWIRAVDGVRLRIAHWPGPRHALILPGRTEYIEKYGQVVADLAASGWGALVLDWRGQGLSDRLDADPRLGHVESFGDYQHDLDAALAAAQTLAPGSHPWLTHSMGGCIALRGLLRGAKPPAVAFSSPMLGLAQPEALKQVVRALARIARPLRLDHRYAPTTGPDYGLSTMTFADNNLTTDRAQFDRMKAQLDEDARFALGGPSLRWMAESLDEIAALARQPSPDTPALFGIAEDDTIVSTAAIRDRAERWPGCERASYPGARHELLMESPDIRNDFLRRVTALFDRTA